VIWLQTATLFGPDEGKISFNEHDISDLKQTDIHTVEPLVPEPSAFEVKMAIEKIKGTKSPGIDQIQVELIKAGGRTIRSDIHKIIYSVWNKEGLPEKWKESVIVPIYKKGKKRIVAIIKAYHFSQINTRFYPTSCCQG